MDDLCNPHEDADIEGYALLRRGYGSEVLPSIQTAFDKAEAYKPFKVVKIFSDNILCFLCTLF